MFHENQLCLKMFETIKQIKSDNQICLKPSMVFETGFWGTPGAKICSLKKIVWGWFCAQVMKICLHPKKLWKNQTYMYIMM
jgi:hypothetical protein